MSESHHEIHLEEYVVSRLTEQGWLEGTTAGYDTERALFTEDVVAWVQQTQPEKWEKLVATNGNAAEQILLDRLVKAIEKEGTAKVLRRGFSVAGAGTIDMSEAAPEDTRNQDVIDRYKANRLRVVRQLKYHPTRQWAIDLGFFINGIPGKLHQAVFCPD